MKRICFILTSIDDSHMLKRASEFQRQGYEVAVCGFKRNRMDDDKDYGFPITNLGLMPRKHYLYRLVFMYRRLKNIRQTVSSDTVIYYIGQDIAMVAQRLFKQSYIYEECDLSFSYIGNRLIQSFLHFLDKRLIKGSVVSVLTSEGFCQYHFGKMKPDNVWIIPNKLDPRCLDYPFVKANTTATDRLRIGYVGKIRFKATLDLLRYASTLSNCTLHFYGIEQWFSEDDKRDFHNLCNEGKIECHGRYNSPDDLASIYSQIDLTVATYDVGSLNPKWAEPNKLYEAIYYETPIVVSAGCYLAQVVQQLNVGFVVDTTKESEIERLFSSINQELLREKTEACRKLGKSFCLDDNTSFFEMLKKLI